MKLFAFEKLQVEKHCHMRPGENPRFTKGMQFKTYFQVKWDFIALVA